MPVKQKKSRAAGRFGTRYGSAVKSRFIKIEDKQRQKQKCPLCNKIGIKRLSNGIWYCKKCDKKFTGDTYYIN